VAEAEQDVALCIQEIEFITSKMTYLRNKIDNAVILSVRQGRYREGSVLPKAQARLKLGPQLLKLAKEKLADAQIALENARIRESAEEVDSEAVDTQLDANVES
jgi:hypothetical protein